MSIFSEDFFAHIAGKNILLTGGTGFVGGHFLQLLCESKAQISCLVRASSNTKDLPPQVRVFEADLNTGHGLQEALEGQHMVVHMAAVLFGLGWQDYLSANVRAAECLAAAIAQSPSIERIVLVSSLSASGPCALSPGVNAATVGTPISAYGWSKYMAEQIFLRCLENKLVILRPPLIYGSKDRALVPYFKTAKMGFVVVPGYKRNFPLSIIHAKDMAQVLVCALKPEAHGLYHCNDGQEHTMAQFGQEMASLQGKQARIVGLPLFILQLSAAVSSLGAAVLAYIWKKFGSKKVFRAPSWNMDKFREAKQEGWLCAGKRMQEELGYTPRMRVREGLQEALDGYKKDGWV